MSDQKSKNTENPTSSAAATTAATRTDPEQPNSNVKQINSVTDLEESITQSGNKVVLVEFYAPWCGPCRMIAPKIEELAKMYFDRMLLVKVDVDDFEDVAMHYNVTSMPTFLIFKDKKQMEMVIGSTSEKELENAISKHCSDSKPAKTPEPTPPPAASGTPASGTSALGTPASSTASSTATKPPAAPSKPAASK